MGGPANWRNNSQFVHPNRSKGHSKYTRGAYPFLGSPYFRTGEHHLLQEQGK